MVWWAQDRLTVTEKDLGHCLVRITWDICCTELYSGVCSSKFSQLCPHFPFCVTTSHPVLPGPFTDSLTILLITTFFHVQAISVLKCLNHVLVEMCNNIMVFIKVQQVSLKVKFLQVVELRTHVDYCLFCHIIACIDWQIDAELPL